MWSEGTCSLFFFALFLLLFTDALLLFLGFAANGLVPSIEIGDLLLIALSLVLLVGFELLFLMQLLPDHSGITVLLEFFVARDEGRGRITFLVGEDGCQVRQRGGCGAAAQDRIVSLCDGA